MRVASGHGAAENLPPLRIAGPLRTGWRPPGRGSLPAPGRLPREESWPPARASPPDSGSGADQRESGPGERGCLARLWRVWRRTVLGVRAGRRRPARRLPAPGRRTVDANPTGSGSGIAWTALPREAGHRPPLGEARLDEARGDRGLLAGRRPCGQPETPGRKGSRPEQQATADPGLAESRSAVPRAACP